MSVENDPRPLSAETHNPHVENRAIPTSVRSEKPVLVDSGLRPAPSMMGTLIASAALAIVCGGAGAWGYEQFLAKKDASPPAAASAATAPSASTAPEAFPAEQGKALQQNIDALRDRTKQLEDQLASLPKTQPTDDIRDLKAQIEDLRKTSSRVETAGEKIADLSDRLAMVEKNLTATRNDVSRLHTTVESIPIHGDARTGSTGSDHSARDIAKPAEFNPKADQKDLDRGAKLLNDKKYADALAVFQGLQTSHSDDARVWYFSALARGFSTGDWRGDTERLVEHGVERERLGSPSSSQIDEVFASLTKDTGKDWLSFYRQRAKIGP